MKDKLGKQIMQEFVGIKAKTCSYLKDKKNEDKKQKVKKVYYKKKT